MKTRVSAYALAIRDGHILMTQLAPYCMRGGSWTFPGGGMDHGELPEETLVREVFEETGLTPEHPKLVDAHSYSESERGPFMAVQLIYEVQMRGTPKVVEQSGSTADVAWVDLGRLGELPTVPFVDAVLQRLAMRGAAPAQPLAVSR